MIRTLLTIGVLFFLTLFAPAWVQIVAYGVAVLAVPYRFTLFIPSVFSDVLYVPTRTLAVGHFKMTFIVLAMLLLYWFITTQTRITQVYGVEKK